MNDLKNISVVLPSLNPDENLLRVVEGLVDVGFSDIILVNDGSDPECLHFFASACRHPQVQLLEHSVNRGKGAALKTAFGWVLQHRPDSQGVVTVDGDGQHHPEDILACARMMAQTQQVVLGCRDFSLPHVPKRSRYGNNITRAVFQIFCGMTLSDTQTGLRGIPVNVLETFCSVQGDRFEYETNMLLVVKEQGIPYREVKIRTVYIEGNKSSHFHAVRDSVRIYALILRHFFRYTLASMLSALVDTGVFALLSRLLCGFLGGLALDVVTTGTARVVSSFVNFILNKKLVFHSKASTKKSLVRYYCLAIPIFLLQLGLTHGTYLLLGIGDAQVFLRTVIYVIVMAVLYVLSFILQQRWVFFPGANERK